MGEPKTFVPSNIKHVVTFGDPFGEQIYVNLGNPDKEAELALKLQERAAELLDRYKDNPEMLDRLFKVQSFQPPPGTTDQPESPTALNEAIEHNSKLVDPPTIQLF
jgi:hypothetical protein